MDARTRQPDGEAGAPAARLRAQRTASARASTRLRSRAMCARGESASLRALETKAMSVGSNPDGGYLVPVEIETEIGKRLAADLADPLDRGRARDLRQRLQEAVHDRGPRQSAGSARPTRARRPTRRRSPSSRSRRWSSTPCRPRPRRCSRTPPSTSTSGSPARSSRCSPRRKAPPSSTATAPTSRRASSPTRRSRKPPGPGPRSATSRPAPPARSTADEPVDALIDLVYALKAGYRQNGTFVMNRKTQAAVRKLKDGDGQYLWQPPAQAGGRASLLTYPVVEAEDMPDIAANCLLDRVRRFPPRLSGGRPPGRARAARSVHRQALCAVLHHQARRRRRAGLRRDQAVEVRGVVTATR